LYVLENPLDFPFVAAVWAGFSSKLSAVERAEVRSFSPEGGPQAALRNMGRVSAARGHSRRFFLSS